MLPKHFQVVRRVNCHSEPTCPIEIVLTGQSNNFQVFRYLCLRPNTQGALLFLSRTDRNMYCNYRP
jgi:hypothetical protein